MTTKNNKGKTSDLAKDLTFEGRENFCFTRPVRVTCSQTWTLENFSVLGKSKDEEVIESEKFSSSAGECEWYVSLYPWQEKGYVGIYLHLHKATAVKVLTTYSFSLRDSTDREIRMQSFVNLFSLPSSNGVGTPHIIPRSTLLRELPNDIFKIRTEVTAVVGEISTPSFARQSEKNLGKHLFSLYNSGNFSDFVISVEGRDIPVHRAILAARSPVLRAMLQSETLEETSRRMEIIDFEFQVVESMLKFIYNDVVPELDVPLAMNLLAAADKYAVDDLKVTCANYLETQLNSSNVLDILLLADTHSVPELKCKCIDFYLSNSGSISPLVDKRNDFEQRSNLLFDILMAMTKLEILSQKQ